MRMDCQYTAWAEKESQWRTRGDVRSVVRFGHIDRGWLPWSAVTCQVANVLAAGNLTKPLRAAGCAGPGRRSGWHRPLEGRLRGLLATGSLR